MTASAQTQQQLDRQLVQALFTLMQAQPWLVSKGDELLDLMAYCGTPRQQIMLVDLLHRTLHVTYSAFHSSIEAMRNQVETVWALNPKSTWFVSSNSSESTDSSQEVLNLLKSAHWKGAGWVRKRFRTRFREIVDCATSGDTIVIVDDFVGSGKTIIDAIGWIHDHLALAEKACTIKVLVSSGCQSGLLEIQKAGTEVFWVHAVKRGLTDYLSGTALADAVIDMGALEDKLEKQARSKSFSLYRFGWGKREAVYVRDGGNTPNNVFPILWWDNTKGVRRRTVMHRT
jgi:hypothetical protein